MEKGGMTYIVTNKNRTTLYTGSTSDIESRVIEHKSKEFPKSFTARYNAGILVYFENFSSIEEAIEREKYIKGKNRLWKNNLITKFNPTWRDLNEDF